MHREIMQPPEGMIVDHIDGNKANNCRFNLRVCTRPENQRNQRKQHGASSSFKGVGYDKRRDRYYARIRFNRRRIQIGHFKDEVEAARAYDFRAVGLFGEYAYLNFPEEWLPERRQEVYTQHLHTAESSSVRTRPNSQRAKGKKVTRKERKKVGMEEGKRKDAPAGKKKAQHPRRGESSVARPPTAAQTPKAPRRPQPARRKTNQSPRSSQ